MCSWAFSPDYSWVLHVLDNPARERGARRAERAADHRDARSIAQDLYVAAFLLAPKHASQQLSNRFVNALQQCHES